MKLGLFGINFGPCADPALALRVARAAEDAGFESVWTGEHVVLPDPQAAAVAGAARHADARSRRRAGVPRRAARSACASAPASSSCRSATRWCSRRSSRASTCVSGGRLLFGLGAGYLKPEFDALGVSFERKGARTNEAIEVIRTLWTQPKPEFHGRFWSFSGIQALPHPVQKPHPPIVVGGHSPGAFRRAVAQGNGWYGFALDLERTRACVEGLEQARAHVTRPASLPPLEIGVTPARRARPRRACGATRISA